MRINTCGREGTEASYVDRGKSTNSSVQFSSVAQSCPTLCDPLNRSILGLPVHHQLLEFTQTHFHLVSDAALANFKGYTRDKMAQHSCIYVYIERASLVAQLVKNLPAMQETLVRFLG